ncbi:flowering time control protein FPA [Dorcoceras hygrometricum]|uniref:Flowering time control protein FPA n=1 Tax=Dorcoceras hygrometricum TaxID=472368 RepID=A0A2Z7CU19_9LAMI|nr:flowering time control protein FPA [Dorcoceras hygrometricum]
MKKHRVVARLKILEKSGPAVHSLVSNFWQISAPGSILPWLRKLGESWDEGIDQLNFHSAQLGYLKLLQMGTQTQQDKAGNKYEVKPQYEELSKQMSTLVNGTVAGDRLRDLVFLYRARVIVRVKRSADICFERCGVVPLSCCIVVLDFQHLACFCIARARDLVCATVGETRCHRCVIVWICTRELAGVKLLVFEAFGEICAVRFSCGFKLLDYSCWYLLPRINKAGRNLFAGCEFLPCHVRICEVEFVELRYELSIFSSFRREHAVIDVVSLAAVTYVNQCVE